MPNHWLFLSCAVAAALAAENRGFAKDRAHPKGKEKTMETTNAASDFVEQREAPEPFFIEWKVCPALSKPSGGRILRDGSVWWYNDLYVIRKDENIRWGRLSLPRWYSRGGRLTEEEMESLTAVIRERVLSLPAEIPIEGIVMDGTHVYWTVDLDGKRHTIHWVDVGDPKPPALEELDSMITRHTNNAIDRRREEKKGKRPGEQAK